MSVRRTTVFIAAAATAVVLALSGCGSSSSDSAPSSKQAAPEGAVPAQGDAGAGPAMDNKLEGNPQGNTAQGSGTQQQVPDNIDTQDRAIIYSGTMTVRVKDVNAAAAQAIALATGAGGFIGADNRQINGQSSTGTITLRVPAAKFQATLDALSKTLGEEESRQLSAQDVTDQVADVDSRIQTAQASVERIRALMAKAQTIGEITSLESELSRRESDLESLQARKRRLDGLTALSTITVVLRGPEAPVVSEEDTGITVGLRNGWKAFVASLRVALTVLGWLLPWLVFVGLPIFLIVWLPRRYRRTHPRPVRPVPGGLVPAAPVAAGAFPPPGGPFPPRPQPPVSAPPARPPADEPGEPGAAAVSDPAAGAGAESRRAPEAAAGPRPDPAEEGPSGPASAR
ncbi:DUF4349 domain-containing protein [Dactylosporangium sp. CA-092794]|uniref:DUF4349 domain-containing protein n=1 Tax=Dactylosporangium sp. CA-092794 TaxID=3239929 RepID=UPI003D8C2914